MGLDSHVISATYALGLFLEISLGNLFWFMYCFWRLWRVYLVVKKEALIEFSWRILVQTNHLAHTNQQWHTSLPHRNPTHHAHESLFGRIGCTMPLSDRLCFSKISANSQRFEPLSKQSSGNGWGFGMHRLRRVCDEELGKKNTIHTRKACIQSEKLSSFDQSQNTHVLGQAKDLPNTGRWAISVGKMKQNLRPICSWPTNFSIYIRFSPPWKKPLHWLLNLRSLVL